MLYESASWTDANVLGARKSSNQSHRPAWKLAFAVRLAKFLLPLAITVLALGCSMQYISSNSRKMLSYEKQLGALRSQIRRSDKTFADRVKREVSDLLQSHLDHAISKRDASDDLEPYQAQLRKPKNGSGVTYLHWGRRDCPSDGATKFIYSGYMAGGHYTHTGSGANYMCIHHNVEHIPGRYVNGNQGSAYVYGVEFRDSSWIYPFFNLSQTEANGMQFHSVPCAMCLATSRFSKIVIPGRGDCPAGWHQEYTGYIMSSGHSDKHPTEFVCVDETPHIVPGTIGDQGGASLYIVETQCASLLCEPFVVGRELRCAVCTI